MNIGQAAFTEAGLLHPDPFVSLGEYNCYMASRGGGVRLLAPALLL